MNKMPPSAMPRPSQPPSWVPPDYITIPEHLKSQPIKPLRSSLVGSRATTRLRRLLDAAGVRVLGDLDGRRLSDFGEYRKAGGAMLWALRVVILGAIKPGAELDMSTRPIPMLHWWPLEQTMVVGPAAFNLQPNDLPISPRLEAVLKDLCIDRLGDFHGRPRSRPIGPAASRASDGGRTGGLAGPSRGWGVYHLRAGARLKRARRPAAPDRRPRQSPTRAGPGQPDDAIWSRRARSPSLSEIGERQRLSGSAVGQRLIWAVRWMRREGSLKLRALLDQIDGLCGKRQVAFSPRGSF